MGLLGDILGPLSGIPIVGPILGEIGGTNQDLRAPQRSFERAQDIYGQMLPMQQQARMNQMQDLGQMFGPMNRMLQQAGGEAIPWPTQNPYGGTVGFGGGQMTLDGQGQRVPPPMPTGGPGGIFDKLAAKMPPGLPAPQGVPQPPRTYR